MNKRITISQGIIASFIVFALVSIFIKGPGSNGKIETLLSVASFLFGIFVAFSIANNHSRYSKLAELLKEHDGVILFLYHISDIFGKKAKRDIQQLIDNYLIDQLDYFLRDFRCSSGSFLRIFQYVIHIKSKNRSQEISYDNMVDLLTEGISQRKRVETLIQEPMIRFEWISILSLLSIILFCIFYLNDGGIVSVIISTLLSTSTAILLFVLRDLNDLTWKERCWVWQPIELLFRELDLLPYFPKPALDLKRAKPEKGQKIRVADYPKRYPDMTGKIVKIVEI